MTESTETIKTEDNGSKPRSSKKVRAPLPPSSGSQSSLISASDNIVHLSQASPKTERKQVTHTQPETEGTGKLRSGRIENKSLKIIRVISITCTYFLSICLSLFHANFFVGNSSFEFKKVYTSDKSFHTKISPYEVFGRRVFNFSFTLERIL